MREGKVVFMGGPLGEEPHERVTVFDDGRVVLHDPMSGPELLDELLESLWAMALSNAMTGLPR